MCDVNDNNANVDLKSIQIIGCGVYNPDCPKSVHPNSCSKLQKESKDCNGEKKPLTKNILAEKLKHLLRSGNV